MLKLPRQKSNYFRYYLAIFYVQIFAGSNIPVFMYVQIYVLYTCKGRKYINHALCHFEYNTHTICTSSHVNKTRKKTFLAIIYVQLFADRKIPVCVSMYVCTNFSLIYIQVQTKFVNFVFCKLLDCM